MITSKQKFNKTILGKLAYTDGTLEKIVQTHTIDDLGNGHHELVVLKNGFEYGFDEICIIDKVYFREVKNAYTQTIIAVVIVDGRTYVGSSTYNPADGDVIERNIVDGRKLALARALKDEFVEGVIVEELAEEFNGTDGDEEDNYKKEDADRDEDLPND